MTATRKPWIAAVAGFALGGGCEFAIMAEFIIAADTASPGAESGSARPAMAQRKPASTPTMGFSEYRARERCRRSASTS